MALFGDSLAAYRAPSALAQALATLLAGLIARELGGGRFAQVTAAVAVCCVPFSMLAGSMLQYTSPDYLWWVLAAWLLLKLANGGDPRWRSEEHTSELQSLMRISYAVFCLKKKNNQVQPYQL